MVSAIQEAIQFYKSIIIKIINQISIKQLLGELGVIIAILFFINSFAKTIENLIPIRHSIINTILMLAPIIVISKIIYTIYQYKFKIFSTPEDKQLFKTNNIYHIKQMIYGYLWIFFGRFIITFIFSFLSMMIGEDNIHSTGQPRETYIALVLLTTLIVKSFRIIVLNLVNKKIKNYQLNYIIAPIIFLLGVLIYLSTIS